MPDRGRDADTAAALEHLAGLAEVTAVVERTREACIALRRHPALRRRVAAARAEATIRAARSSAALAGAALPVSLFRAAAQGRGRFPEDATGRTARGAMRALAEAERLAQTWQQAPLQALARLHTAASAGLVAQEALGRPRPAGAQPGDGTDLHDPAGGPLSAPDGEQLAGRLEALASLMRAPESVPALVVAALVHAEVAVARPFAAGNGVVARALCRTVVIERGLDASGVAVWEAALLESGPGYAEALSAYAGGKPSGVIGWICSFGAAVQAGALEGQAVCDAVLAGQLPD
jgi:Fic family protein